MKKIVIFGLGYLWENKKNKIKSETKIIALIDNDHKLWNIKQEGIQIYEPIRIKEIIFDYVVIMNNRNFSAMRDQLLEYNVPSWKIKHFEEFLGEMHPGVLHTYSVSSAQRRGGKKIIVFGYELMYIGSSLTAKYAAESLYEKGYDVTIAVTDSQKSLINELVSEGIQVLIYPNLKYATYDSLKFLDEYDNIIINTFSLVHLVHEISSHRKLIWWLHDQIYAYNEYLSRYNNLTFNFKNIAVYAVSKIAKNIFNMYFPNIQAKIMPYGFYDEIHLSVSNCSVKTFFSSSKKIVFAIIGYINHVKAQDIFLKAAIELNFDEVEFWIIGKEKGTREYCGYIKQLAKKIRNIRFFDEIPRSKMKDLYQKIDVVVNTSREDMLPTVVAEGMMFSKICITSDITGMADYIKDKINGFIFRTEDYIDLSKKYMWILNNQNQLKTIRNNARKTYENYFTISSLGQRLENAIQEIS